MTAESAIATMPDVPDELMDHRREITEMAVAIQELSVVANMVGMIQSMHANKMIKDIPRDRYMQLCRVKAADIFDGVFPLPVRTIQ